MSKIEIIPTDIKTIDTFTKYGARFIRRSYNEATDIYVYERWNDDGNGGVYLSCLEVVKPKYKKLSSGKRIGSYPSSEDFGPLGKCVSINQHTDRMVEFLVNNPDKWDPQSIYDFKKTL